MTEATPPPPRRSPWLPVGLALAGLLVGAAATAFVLINPLGLAFLPGGSGGGNASAAPAGDGSLYTCGMHPSVLQEEPGMCPICHMDLTPLSMDGPAGAMGSHDHEGVALYTCPMHPIILDEEPGTCPICDRNLVPVDTGNMVGDQGSGPPRSNEVALWTCPMHPDILAEEPGSCPICGMDLVPVDTGDMAGDQGSGTQRSGEKPAYYRHPHDATIVSPEPRKDEMGMDFIPIYEDPRILEQGPVVTIPRGTIQAMNVVIGEARRGDLVRTIETVGTIDFDQARMVSVTTKYRGYVEDVHANYLGQQVRRGAPLFEVYSPELVQTQEELLSAVRYAERMESAPPDARRRAEALVDAAKRRLAYWDVSDAEVRRILERGEPMRTVTVTAPASGDIMKRMPGLKGMAITPGMDVLHLADLSSLWLDVQLYEDQVAWVEPGSEATVTFAGLPGSTYTGRVRFIQPTVDEKTRTATLTLEVPNPDGKLRVGMFASVTFEPVLLEDVVLVPSQAILRTGRRDVAVVAFGGGRFAPRDVILGPEGQNEVAVLEGLEAGDDVVLSAQFLIDSESRLREAVMKMIAEKRSASSAGR